MQQTTNLINQQPKIILHRIFLFVSETDLISSAQRVCHLWHHTVKDDQLWKELLHRRRRLYNLLRIEALEDVFNDDDGMVSEDDFSVPIYPIPDDSPENILMNTDEHGPSEIKAASINKLIVKLTSVQDYDLNFTKQFLLTYTSFITPCRLFAKLVERYAVPIPEELPTNITASEYIRRNIFPVQSRVVLVLKLWLQSAFHETNERAVLQKQVNFVDNILANENSILAKQTKKILQRRILANQPPSPPISHSDIYNISTNNSSVEDMFRSFKDKEIAEQITLKDFSLYSAVKAHELISRAQNRRGVQPNLMTAIEWFNRLSKWAVDMILSHKTIKLRVHSFVRLVSIAEHLRDLNNFASTMAILAGLNSGAIVRLKHTHNELPSRTKLQLEALFELTSSKASYKSLRLALRNMTPPCVP
eukprot:TRINITY_DN6812_c0_g1_i2.p1 TRINITY_DN6812_c0_g1~~TRINITY_DN6812_c0_g1_i2.p1  ORF type:complete len:419 (-),score=59.34 TRINITY_DN6812_c0_g1_i2:1-1257(-)